MSVRQIVEEVARCRWEQLSPRERFDAVLKYEGIIGFTDEIIEWAKECGYEVTARG
jgi:hypothetical protein